MVKFKWSKYMDGSKFINFISGVSSIIGIIGFLFNISEKRHKWCVFFSMVIITSICTIVDWTKVFPEDSDGINVVNDMVNNEIADNEIDMIDDEKDIGKEEMADKNIAKNQYIEKIDNLVQQEEYESAYSILCQAIEKLGADDNLVSRKTDIIQKYEQYIIENAEKLLEEKEYDDALSIISVSKSILTDDILILNEENKIIEEKIKSECYGFEADNNYIEAIKYIQNNYYTELNNTAVAEILNNYKERYRDQILYEAQNIFIQDGYLAAINRLEEGLIILDNDAALMNKIIEYREYTPVSVFDLEPFQGKAYWFKSINAPFNDENNWLVDMYGTSFNEGYIAHHYEEKGEMDVVYLLDNKYTTCSVMLAWPRGASHLTEAGGYIKFYGDGQEIYTSPEIKCGDRPIQFSFDVTGVEKLGFERIATGKGSTWMSVVIIYPYFYLQK